MRNLGTIGGSVANNDPAADYPAAVLGLGATIVTNKRQNAADGFFTGLFSTALEPGEIITAIRFPIPDKAGYDKFDQRASRLLSGQRVRRAKAGACFPPARCGSRYRGRATMAYSARRKWKQALKSNFAPSAVSERPSSPAKMIGDMHGSADYRAALGLGDGGARGAGALA